MAAKQSSVVARVGMDDSGFQQGISRLNRSLKLVKSEFAEASSKLKGFGNSTEGLKLKTDTLSKEIDIQKEKVKALSKSYKESVDKKGQDSKATENLKIKLNYATASLNKMEQELKAATKELNTKSSAWYKLSKSMDAASSKMKLVGDKMVSAGKSLTNYVTAPILGLGAATTKMAMDTIESENLFKESMGSMADSARSWSEELSKSLGLNSYGVRQNVATLNAMLDSIGLAVDASLDMSEGLTKLSYDMASFYNLKPEEAFDKLKSGISGEAEPLKALGILINDTTIKTYAYTHGIAKQGAQLTEQQKVMARYGAIMEQTKKAQGDLARTMDSPTNKLRAMKEKTTQLAISFGQLLIPVLDKLINIISPVIDRFNSLNTEQKEMIVKVALVVAAIGPLILIIGKVITIVSTAISVFSTISGAIAAAGGMFTLLTGPIGIAIASITAIISVGVLLYKNWDTIKQKASELKDRISSKFNDIKMSIASSWNSAKENTRKVFGAIAGEISKNGSGIKGILVTYTKVWGAVWSSGFNVLDKLTSGKLSSIKNTVLSKVNDIKNRFKNLLNVNVVVPKVKLPHISIKGKFSLSPPSVPSVGVSWYDKGGVFNKPSVIGVGEKRPEFVGALEDLRYLLRDELLKNNQGTKTQIIFQGNYSFNEKSDIDYFMNRAAQLIKRRVK